MKQIIICSDQTMYELESSHYTSVKNFKLIRSNADKGWLKPGTTCVHLTDDGNDVKLKIDKKTIKLPYHELCVLFIVLQEYFKVHSDGRIKYKVFKEEK